MLPRLIMPGDYNVPKHFTPDAYIGGGFASSAGASTFNFSGGGGFLAGAPVGNHLAVVAISWMNDASPATVTNYSHGSIVWPILSQISTGNSAGIALVSRQLSATEITNLVITNTGSVNFSSRVFGVRTGRWMVEGMRSVSSYSYVLGRSTSPANTISVDMGHIPQGSLALGVGFVNSVSENAQFTAGSPLVGRAPSPNDDNLSVVISQAPKYNSGWGKTLRYDKSGTARYLAMAGLVFR